MVTCVILSRRVFLLLLPPGLQDFLVGMNEVIRIIPLDRVEDTWACRTLEIDICPPGSAHGLKVAVLVLVEQDVEKRAMGPKARCPIMLGSIHVAHVASCALIA